MKIPDIYNKITQSANFKSRKAQLRMITTIDKCLNDIEEDMADKGDNILLIEAPTGTGKSLAYLLSGVIHAKKAQKKLVITTATKTLQGQLINKDIPKFIQNSGISFEYGLAKGRSNYMCPLQLDLNLDSMSLDMFATESALKKELTQVKQIFRDKLWDGDLDQIPIKLDREVRSLITTDKDRCLNYSCAYNKKGESSCPFYLNKEKLALSEVIVTNHSLLLADLALGGGNVLPSKPQDYILCMDEAHNFSDIAIKNFTAKFDLKMTITNVKNLANFIYNPQAGHYAHTDIKTCDEISKKANDLSNNLEEYLQLLSHNTQCFKDDRLILNDYINPEGAAFCEVFVNFAFLSFQIIADLTNFQQVLRDELKQKANQLLQSSLDKVGFYLSVIELIHQVSSYMLNQDSSRFNCHAKWIELKATTKNELDFEVSASVTHVGEKLSSLLWSQVYGAVLTSATLAVGQDFSYYEGVLGLSAYTKLKRLKLESDFTYPNQAQIVVPRFSYAPEYTSLKEFNQELKDYLEKVLDYDEPYGTLVIFFNRAMAQASYDLLPFKLRAKILLQMDYPSNKSLIMQHIKNIDNQKPSIIFGLTSFAEGVDLPSLYCMHVIITKLPFETFKDPQSVAQEYWFKFEKANYFSEVSLPKAGIKLIQATGRLIRSEDDFGQITICDNRIIKKGYGVALLNALPNFNRKYNENFIQSSYHKLKENFVVDISNDDFES